MDNLLNQFVELMNSSLTILMENKLQWELLNLKMKNGQHILANLVGLLMEFSQSQMDLMLME